MSTDIERKLISLLVVTENMTAVCDAGLRPEVFEEPINRRVFEWMTDYFRDTKAAPTPLVMQTEFPAVLLVPVEEVKENIDWLITYLRRRYIINQGQDIIRTAVGSLSEDPEGTLTALHTATGQICDSTGLSDAAVLHRLARSAAYLDGQVFDPLEMHVEGIIPEGYGVLAGPPKLGKSWLVACIALPVAQGGTALGCIDVQQRPVLYLALEDGARRLQSRFRIIQRSITKGHSGFPARLPDGLEYLTAGVTREDAVKAIKAFYEAHAGERPLVIVDTFAKIRAPRKRGDDAYQADYDQGVEFKKLIPPGGSLLMVHHNRKAAAEDFVDAVSGTHGVTGPADYVLVLKRKRNSDEGVLAVTGRDIEENDYAMKVEGGTWRIDGDSLEAARAAVGTRATDVRLGERQQALLTFVRLKSPAEVTADMVAQQLCIEPPFTPKTAGDALRELTNRGYLWRPRRGAYVTNTPESPEIHKTPDQKPFFNSGVPDPCPESPESDD